VKAISFGLTLNRKWFAWGRLLRIQRLRGYAALLETGSMPKAVFAASDLLALGAIARRNGACASRGCCIISAMTSKPAIHRPALTTIRQNKERLGVLAAHMLFDSSTINRMAVPLSSNRR
jgi:LacI family transcriptional regulator